MAVSKQLLLLQIVLVTSVIVNEASAGQLRDLVQDRLVPDFQNGGLVLQGKTQFAVAILQPGTQWMKFLYKPSKNGDGKKPVITTTSSLSPPDSSTYDNYLAARPNNGVHSEIQILDRLDSLYNAYKAKHNGRPPKALLLYSWIVPCTGCTDKIIAKLTSEPFKSIQTKVVAYTTCGTYVPGCNVNETKNKFKNTGIDLIRIKTLKEELIQNLLAQLILE